jgi:hypothetical protein
METEIVYTSENPKPLPEEFNGRASQKEFTFKLVKREKNIAIYEKKSGDDCTYREVIVVKSHNGLKFGENTTPPSEFYPGDNQFGLWGWCYRDSETEKIEAKFQELLTKQD